VDLTEDDLVAQCHANCIESTRESARRAPLTGEVIERDGMMLYATGADFPIIANGAFRLDEATNATDVIAAADAWFAERGRGWSLGTVARGDQDRDLRAAAEAAGMVATIDMAAMVCDARLPDAPHPDGIVLRALTTEDQALAFTAMCDQAYTSLGLPQGVFTSMVAPPLRTPPPYEVTIGAFDGDGLVSGAQVLFSHGIAGVYAVGTAAGARGRGLAELVTRTVTNLAFDRGVRWVTLQASPMGESIYRRMGYRDLYRYINHTRFL
jgi:ribosomal protein S18 acetylase RimI-like enzyme